MKVQYLHTLVRGEDFCRFDLFSNDVENVDTSLTVDNLLKGLACNFSCDFPFKKKACNAPLYEKTIQLKGEVLCIALNWFE